MIFQQRRKLARRSSWPRSGGIGEGRDDVARL